MDFVREIFRTITERALQVHREDALLLRDLSDGRDYFAVHRQQGTAEDEQPQSFHPFLLSRCQNKAFCATCKHADNFPCRQFYIEDAQSDE